VTTDAVLPAGRFGPYEVVGRLGAGGMGEVWLARDTRLEREVALKRLPAHLTGDRDALAMFRNEALALASLNHPNIATLHGLEELPGGAVVLVLEHVEGESLATRLTRGPLPVPEALQMCAQIAQALEVAHASGVVHCDLKPGNIMLGPRGLVKVLDFGLARRSAGFAGARPTRTAPSPADRSDGVPAGAPPPGTTSGLIAGTPGYMSPEQVLEGVHDPRTDLFALGCILYECLCGRRAFPADDPYAAMAQTLNDTPDLSALPDRTPVPVRELLAACLAKDLAARPAGARPVRLVLEETLGIRRAAALREGETVTTPHNLPAPASSFVGREATLATCARALEGTRLLTLTAMGGSGKTRLAVRLAETRLDTFTDGVWFVDAAPLTEPGRLVEALAEALDVRDEPARTLLEGVVRRLAQERALVVIDNAETHPAACGALAARLLAHCRDVKLLVTSREPLGIEGETVFTVPPLGIPGSDATAAAARASEAVSLFCERARAVAPDFELNDANAGAVVEICRRLDGVPLALELAAARVRLLGVEQIRARLGDRFKLLARPGAGAPTRQQTVLATIQWSWDHLLEPERDLLRRLAVFTGGWTLERAAAVCSDTRDEFEMLDLLTRLAERSLVVVQRDGAHAPRYGLLESVWRFALDRLEAHPEHAAMRERHLDVYVDLAEHFEQAIAGSDQAHAVATLAAEEENVLAALAWCAHAPDGARPGLRLATAVSRFWSVRGRYALGARVLAEALGRDAAREPTLLRTKALTRVAGFVLMMGDQDAARPHLEESLAVSRLTGDRQGEARALGGLAVVAMGQMRLDDALAMAGQAMTMYGALGQRRGVGMALHNLGTIESALGRPDHGRARFEAALALFREIGDVLTETLCLTGLGTALVRGGDLEGARRRLSECCELVERLELPREGFNALEAVAELLCADGQAGRAARLLGAAEAARLLVGSPLMPFERSDMAKLLARVEDALGAGDAARARTEGRALTMAAALAEARAALGGDETGTAPPA
jgi:predicted ATPase